MSNYIAGTIIVLTAALAVTIGSLVTVYPVGADESLPISGAIPPVDGPTPGVVVSAYRPMGLGRDLAKVKLLAPGKPNHGRIVIVDAETVSNA